MGSGCADSPFKINTRKDTDSLIITIGDKEGNKVNVDYNRLRDPADLQAVLNKYGMRYPKRAVTLELPDDPDPRIEVSVTRMVRSAGLGELSVLEGAEMRGRFRSRPARDKILEKPAPEPVKTPPAAAPDTPPAPARTPVPTPAKPAGGAPESPGNVVTVLARDDGQFLVNNACIVPLGQLHAALAEIGKTAPNAKVLYTREPNAPADAPLNVYKAAKGTGLGAVSAK
jgi:hypothetical protein